ncbi:MAG: aminoacyl-histidine dipeptidase [Ruminococcaceae bacterium]|nr:aminoacyl-histidine dipeptidase [Oscillospiraceae bacterium]
MGILSKAEPYEVFKYFEEICAVPHGSGDMDKIAEYCVSFAKSNNLEYVHDDANNVIIYKNGTKGYEDHPPVILQGHIDMVCQKTEESTIDFEKDGLTIYTEGDFVKADGTTLGADNGIAVAMIMAVLASDKLSHPPIEAVFTTDEEIGMIGAGKLDVSLLKSKRMINLDSEEEDVLTVSCAGGSDFKARLDVKRKTVSAKRVQVTVSGLLGGHSGVEIDKGRVNANILMGRILNTVRESADFGIISVNGGDKGNAIPLLSVAEIATCDVERFMKAFEDCKDLLDMELKGREKDMEISATLGGDGDYQVLDDDCGEMLMYFMMHTPNGIVDMSAEISGLVETSLNIGILKTEDSFVYAQYALRSNKSSALDYLQQKMINFAKFLGFSTEITGRYEPWEYQNNSALQELYTKTYTEVIGKPPKVEAIHAGLECAVFSASIPGLDCIAIGPDMTGVHTTEEKLSISSTGKIFDVLCRVLEKM